MNTDKGMNYQAILWLAMSAVTTMDTGVERNVLLGLAMVVMAIVAWRTTGSGLSPHQTDELLDTTQDIQDVLEQGAQVKTSQAGIDIIKSFEGLRLEAYPDPGTGAAPYTIGYGTTKGIRRGMKITLTEAEEFLKRDLEYFERGVDRLIAGIPTTQSQFDAFVSFSYNCGLGAFQRSSILRHHRAGNRLRAAASFLMWVKAAGRTLPGLVRRRNAERKLYLS